MPGLTLLFNIFMLPQGLLKCPQIQWPISTWGMPSLLCDTLGVHPSMRHPPSHAAFEERLPVLEPTDCCLRCYGSKPVGNRLSAASCIAFWGPRLKTMPIRHRKHDHKLQIGLHAFHQTCISNRQEVIQAGCTVCKQTNDSTRLGIHVMQM